MDVTVEQREGVDHSDEQLLKERGYRFIRQLGEGSYAKVYLTIHNQPGKPDHTLACKVINARKAPKEYVAKFLPRELEVIGKVAHPNVIHTHAIFSRNNKFLIFMRYAENGDLLEFVLRKGELKEVVARVWLYQLVLAMQYLHLLDIAHRDIKCENILISVNYNMKLADFGFSRFVTSNGRPVLSSTYCGSLIYASPEILKGKPYYPKCSDVWSLGVVAYIILNKTIPFSENNSRALYKMQMEKNWHFRRRVAPTLTVNIMNLVAKMLDPNYKTRPTIEDIASDKYFKDFGLEMTENERVALNYAIKHKSSIQKTKKPNISDVALFTSEEAKDSFFSSVVVTMDSLNIKAAETETEVTEEEDKRFVTTVTAAEKQEDLLSKEKLTIEENLSTVA